MQTHAIEFGIHGNGPRCSFTPVFKGFLACSRHSAAMLPLRAIGSRLTVPFESAAKGC